MYLLTVCMTCWSGGDDAAHKLGSWTLGCTCWQCIRSVFQVVMTFLMDYPLKDKCIQEHLDFFVCQLNYELDHGRTSALDMIKEVVTRFPVVRSFFACSKLNFVEDRTHKYMALPVGTKQLQMPFPCLATTLPQKASFHGWSFCQGENAHQAFTDRQIII